GERDGARGQAHGEGRQHPVTARCERHRDTPSIVRREGGDDHAVCPPVHEPARSAWTPIPLVPTHAVAASGSLTVKADQDGPRRTKTDQDGQDGPTVMVWLLRQCPALSRRVRLPVSCSLTLKADQAGPRPTKPDQRHALVAPALSGAALSCPPLFVYRQAARHRLWR